MAAAWEIEIEELEGMAKGFQAVTVRGLAQSEAESQAIAERLASELRSRLCKWTRLAVRPSCPLRTSGALILAGAIQEAGRNSHLASLNLQGNEVKDEGCAAICDALMDGGNTSMRVLNLGKNDIGDDGACACAELIERSHTLRTIALDRNRITDEGGEALAVGLKGSPGSLRSVFALGNQISSETLKSINALLPTADDAQNMQSTPTTKAARD